MAGDVPHANLWTLYYIRSKEAFNRARMLGNWEVVWRRLMGRNPYLRKAPMPDRVQYSTESNCLGLLEIATHRIVGSLGREREFSHRFLPVSSSTRQEERWRLSFVMAMMGSGYQPLEVYQIADGFFVLNGHHRVSVARYLGWGTLQAHVYELLLSPDCI
jgi:hypothetical protein